MNYISLIDAEIVQLEQRLRELRIARAVIAPMSEQAASYVSTKRTLRVKKTGKRTAGAAARARGIILAMLTSATQPLHSRDFINALAAEGIGDTTMWGALKDLRNDNVITWDKETRLYELVRNNAVRNTTEEKAS